MNLPSLQTALRSNAIFSTLCGLDLVLFTDQINALVGSSIPPLFLQGLGALLIIFAVDVLWISSRNPINIKVTKVIIAMDWAWVASTPLVLIFAWNLLTPIGVEIICTIAATVALFAVLQSKGIQRESDHLMHNQAPQAQHT